MINSVTLTGRLGKDAELKYTQSGVAVASGTLAVSRQFISKNDEREVDWIRYVIWRKSAENFANFTHKGSLVGLEGRIQTRNYENQQGTRVYVTEVVVENFALLESRQENNNNDAPDNKSGSSDNKTGSNSNTATAKPADNSSQTDPFAGDSPMDISDDDLPF